MLLLPLRFFSSYGCHQGEDGVPSFWLVLTDTSVCFKTRRVGVHSKCLPASSPHPTLWALCTYSFLKFLIFNFVILVKCLRLFWFLTNFSRLSTTFWMCHLNTIYSFYHRCVMCEWYLPKFVRIFGFCYFSIERRKKKTIDKIQVLM